MLTQGVIAFVMAVVVLGIVLGLWLQSLLKKKGQL